MGRQLPIQRRQATARLHLHHTGIWIQLAQLPQLAEIEHQPPTEGYALAVVARARPPQGERHPMAGTGTGHQQHLLQAAGPHRQIRQPPLQQGQQQRRIVEIIAGEPRQLRIQRPWSRLGAGVAGWPDQLQLGIEGLELGRQGGNHGCGGPWRQVGCGHRCIFLR